MMAVDANAVIVRDAMLKDADTIARFNCGVAMESEGKQLDYPLVRAGVEKALSRPDLCRYFVAERNGEVVGQLMITYEWSDWRNGQIWWIQSVYVLPDFRGRGVFTALFRYIESLARSQKEVCSLRLYMHAENAAARRAYERLGMKATAYQVFELELPSRISQYQP